MAAGMSERDLSATPIVMGDRGFLRLNSRLDAAQLQTGEVPVSRNGRMERGVWQPRPAIDSLSGVLQLDGDPLRLPFWLVDTPGGVVISAASRVDETVSLTVSHGFPPTSEPAWIKVSGLTGSVDPNGYQLAYWAGATSLEFAIPGATGSESYSGSGIIITELDDAEAAMIYGSCSFSDPASNSDESIIIAATGVAYKVAVADGSITEIPYPAGETLDASVDMVQSFERVRLFRQDGQQSWDWFGTVGRPVVAASLTSNVVTVTVRDHGRSVGDVVTLADIGFTTTNPNGSRTITGIPDKDNYTFALTGGNEIYTAGTGTEAGGFSKVAAGDYTQPEVFEITGTAVTVVSGLATFTVVGNDTVKTGDRVKIFGATSAVFLPFIGQSFVCTAASATAISFYIPVADLSTISTDKVSIGREVSQGSGFIHCPAPPWGVYNQRRLWTPLWYSQSGTTASPTFTDRKTRDEIVASDILDPDTFDVLTNQFKISGGTADFTVGMQPFYDDAIVIFQRNSIHGVFGVSGALTDSSVNALTDEIGCLARRSIVMHGSEIFFLSDNGVYAIGFLDRYNLRGVELPLSDPIQPEIDRINADLAANSVGIYFENRYYLAVPLDSSAGAGDATGNNSILIFNFLNKGWESVDFVDDSRWNVLNFHIARAGERNDLYVVNDLGGVHRIDAMDSDFDRLALDPGGDIESVKVSSELNTRRFDGETLDRKRFSEVQIQTDSNNQACEAGFVLSVEDFDTDVDLGTITQALGGESLSPNEGASLRMRPGGHRGHNALLKLTPITGRPKFKSVRITAASAFRSTTPAK